MNVDDLADLAGGDRQRARLLEHSLVRLAQGPNELLREMANAVLDGELDLRTAASSTVYGTELGTVFQGFFTLNESMDPERHAAAVNQARDYLQTLDS